MILKKIHSPRFAFQFQPIPPEDTKNGQNQPRGEWRRDPVPEVFHHMMAASTGTETDFILTILGSIVS